MLDTDRPPAQDPTTPPLWRRLLVSTLRIAAMFGAFLLIIFLALAWCTWMPGESWQASLEPLSPAQREAASRMQGTVVQLSQRIGPRYARDPRRYREAAAYLEARLQALGYTVRRQPVSTGEASFDNLIVERKGSQRPEEIIVLGAHYDTRGPTPGANDNASGVAGALEIARRFAKARPARTLRIVLFCNEEPPNFKTASMGSLAHARAAREAGEHIRLAIIFDMIGYYVDRPNSQRFPAGLGYFYPDRANFIAFVSDLGSRAELEDSLRQFRQTTHFPSEGLHAPSFVPGIAMSDQWSFREHDYPALEISDTAFFRYEHYHKRSDTYEKLRYDHMARVLDGAEQVLHHWLAASD